MRGRSEKSLAIVHLSLRVASTKISCHASMIRVCPLELCEVCFSFIEFHALTEAKLRTRTVWFGARRSGNLCTAIFPTLFVPYARV